MKRLLDACVWGGARAVLGTAGHDVVWAGDWERDPGFLREFIDHVAPKLDTYE